MSETRRLAEAIYARLVVSEGEYRVFPRDPRDEGWTPIYTVERFNQLTDGTEEAAPDSDLLREYAELSINAAEAFEKAWAKRGGGP